MEKVKKTKLPKLFVVIDDSDEEGALKKLKKIEDVEGDFGVKLNLDLILKGPAVIGRFKEKSGKKIFTDMKTWNGKRTMAIIMQMLADNGADMTNVYAHAAGMLEKAIVIANDNNITVLGVTVLTHYTEEYCQGLYRRSIGETVSVLGKMALDEGCHGIILPGTMLPNVANLKCIKFTPATRPNWFDNPKVNFQEQITDHREAFDNGATIVSCGSPIFKSPDPVAALQRILAEIAKY
jgi:orotidine-5'-phosphate decarboxylase